MRRPLLWNRNFVLICATTLAFFTSLYMLTPLFPGFLRERASASPVTIGVFIGVFNIIGVLLRPMVGRALATRARRNFMLLGCATTTAASALYLASPSITYLIVLRLAHGIAIASFYTATATLVADSAPEERRGEAFSLFSMFLYLGLAAGPALGLALQSGPGFDAAFLASAAIAVGATALARAIREPREHTPESIEAERHPLVSRAALFPGAVLALAAVGYAASLNFTADFAEGRHIAGRALYFPVLAASVIVVRSFGGRLADRFGRLAVATPGLAAFAAAIGLQSVALSTGPLLISGALAGIGFGFFFPSMMAFTVDRVRAVERASAMGTFTAAFDLGFGLGSPALGAIHGANGYPAMYRVAAVSVCAGLVVLLLGAARARAGARPEVA